ncbi:Ubiquitin-conjugating enzyme E2 32 [Acorus calamus]|uniref:Ubiquitin-conjugating enzyme E2 32 n=1 Tax=Acorus calamus TaxID=4465 RepID=A0AAV9ERD3_ACOCL|nr:Ubiquitin-conjugating enzyme E2 32 [Acorus calamus]
MRGEDEGEVRQTYGYDIKSSAEMSGQNFEQKDSEDCAGGEELSFSKRKRRLKVAASANACSKDQIHEYMLSKAPPIPQPPTPPPTLDDTPNNAESEGNALGAIANLHELHVNADAGPVRVSFTAGLRLTRRVPRSETEMSEQPLRPDLVARKPDDRLFTWAALGLTFAILVLILKKFLKSNGYVGYVGGL